MAEAGWPDEPRALGGTGDVSAELFRLEREREREEQEEQEREVHLGVELEAIDAEADAEVKASASAEADAEDAQRVAKRVRDVDLDDDGDDEDDGGGGTFDLFRSCCIAALSLRLPPPCQLPVARALSLRHDAWATVHCLRLLIYIRVTHKSIETNEVDE